MPYPCETSERTFPTVIFSLHWLCCSLPYVYSFYSFLLIICKIFGLLKLMVPSIYNAVYFETLKSMFQWKVCTLKLIYLPFQAFLHFISLLKFYNVIGCTKLVSKYCHFKKHLPFKSRKITGMWVSIPGTGVLQCKTETIAAFKLTQVYLAHVPYDTSP